MALTTITQVFAANRTMFDRKLLVRLLQRLVHDRFAQVRPIRERMGDQIKFRRLEALSAVTSAMTEGVTPTSVQPTITDITASLAQYGNLIEYSDMVKWTNEIDFLKEYVQILGENAGDSIDQIVRDVLVGGTSAAYSNGSARASVNSIITTTVLDSAIRTLQGNNARPFTPMIRAGEKIGTQAVRPAYWGLMHPHVYYTARGLTGWIDSKDYSNYDGVAPGEVGAYRDLRFILSTNCRIWTGAGGSGGTNVRETSSLADVYATMAIGQDAYGVVPLQVGDNYGGNNKDFEGNIGIIVKPLGYKDALDQVGAIGWKATFTAARLNNSAMVRVESASAT